MRLDLFRRLSRGLSDLLVMDSPGVSSLGEPRTLGPDVLLAQQGFTLSVGIQARLGSSEFCRQLRDLRGRFGQRLDALPNVCTVIQDGTLDFSL